MTESTQTEAPHDPGGDAYWTRPRRLHDDRIVGGVAAGLSAWLGVPVIVVRLGFVVAALLNGIGVLAYAALWLALPADGTEEPEPNRVRVLVAAMLGVVVALIVLDRFDLPRSGILLPLVLVGTGVALWRRNPDRRPRPPAPPAPSIEPSAAPARPAPDTAARPGRRVRLARSDERRAREPRSPIARIALAVAFATLAVALLADRGDALDLTASRGASLVLVILGAALIVGARYGRARWLALVAVPLMIFLPVASTFDDLDVDPFSHLGSRTYFVDRISSPLAPAYRNGMGRLTLDLAGIEPTATAQRTEIRNAIGAIDVFVPHGLQVVIHARVGWGEITVEDLRAVPGSDSIVRGVQLTDEHGRDIERTTTMVGEPGAGSIEIDAALGLGSIRVVRTPSRFERQTSPAPLPSTTVPTTTSAPDSVPTTTLIDTTSETR